MAWESLRGITEAQHDVLVLAAVEEGVTPERLAEHCGLVLATCRERVYWLGKRRLLEQRTRFGAWTLTPVGDAYLEAYPGTPEPCEVPVYQTPPPLKDRIRWSLALSVEVNATALAMRVGCTPRRARLYLRRMGWKPVGHNVWRWSRAA